MSSRTVRIDETTYMLLKQLAERAGMTMLDLLAEAVEGHRRNMFLRQMNADFARLRNNPKAWQEELEERALWDNALCDEQED